MVNYSKEDFGSMVEELGGNNAMMAWIEDANKPDNKFDSKSDSNSNGWERSLSKAENSDESD